MHVSGMGFYRMTFHGRIRCMNVQQHESHIGDSHTCLQTYILWAEFMIRASDILMAGVCQSAPSIHVPLALVLRWVPWLASKWHFVWTRKAIRMWHLIPLLVGGRASIPVLPLVQISTLKSSNLLAVVVDMAPAQTHTKYFSANAASCSVKVSASPMLAKYWTGSDIIAACLVPTLLIQSSSVRISGLITVFDSDAPRHETAWWRLSPVAFCLFQSVVVGEIVEDISDHPNLMEQELKLCYSICIVCGSYYIVTYRTLWHSLNGLLDLHDMSLSQHRTSQGNPAQPNVL